MSIKRITAIVPLAILPTLEEKLRARGVPGVTVEQVQGYGHHPNYFRKDLMKDNARLVLYVDVSEVDKIVDVIVGCADECGTTAGIVAVERIDRLVDLSDGKDLDVTRYR